MNKPEFAGAFRRLWIAVAAFAAAWLVGLDAALWARWMLAGLAGFAFTIDVAVSRKQAQAAAARGQARP